MAVAALPGTGERDGDLEYISRRSGQLGVVSAVRWLVLGLFALYTVLVAAGDWLSGRTEGIGPAYGVLLAVAAACGYAYLCQFYSRTTGSGAASPRSDLLLVAFDAIAVSAVVLSTGGYSSPLRGIYAGVVLEAVILCDRRRLWLAVGVICLTFALAIIGQISTVQGDSEHLGDAFMWGALSWLWVASANGAIALFGGTLRRRIERERSRLHALVVQDSLTGLYNRRYFLHKLNSEVERCRRYGRKMTLLLLDIDHFKKVNDTYGHQKGDDVLARVAEVCRMNIRCRGEDDGYDVDVACRYGGEEFAVIVPEASVEVDCARGSSHVAGSLILAERLRAAVAALDTGAGRVTISMGVASYPTHAESAQGLVAVADKALYEAKRAGRDRVVFARNAPDDLAFGLVEVRETAQA